METSHSQAESFSYRWLVKPKPSITSLDESFIEMDPKLSPSRRFLRRISSCHDFTFNISTNIPKTPLKHAHQLISNGYLIPLNHNHQPSSTSNTTLKNSPKIAKNAVVSSVDDSETECANSASQCGRLWPKRLLKKYFKFLRPLNRIIRSSNNNNNNNNNNNKKDKKIKKRVMCSESACPIINVANCESEHSIYEAVLHCKRSMGKC